MSTLHVGYSRFPNQSPCHLDTTQQENYSLFPLPDLKGMRKKHFILLHITSGARITYGLLPTPYSPLPTHSVYKPDTVTNTLILSFRLDLMFFFLRRIKFDCIQGTPSVCFTNINVCFHPVPLSINKKER